MKKILGTSDAWSTSHLSHWPSEPAYHIVYFRISKVILDSKLQIMKFFTDK